jgi:hypothetical protein
MTPTTGTYKPTKELKISEWPLYAAMRLGEELGIGKETSKPCCADVKQER